MGSITAAIVATVFRFLIGESLIGLPETISFPDYGDADRSPMYPVKTLLMASSLGILISVSAVYRNIVERRNVNDQVLST